MPLWVNIWKPHLDDVSRPHPSWEQKLLCTAVELAQGHEFWDSDWVEGGKQEMGKYPKNLMGFELVEVSLVWLVNPLSNLFTLSECATKAGSCHLSIAQRLHSSGVLAYMLTGDRILSSDNGGVHVCAKQEMWASLHLDNWTWKRYNTLLILISNLFHRFSSNHTSNALSQLVKQKIVE